eukprot:GEMP01002962.1.p1 GENE.GEMP01002962.1~~GEMP01002962.1.p1  ORF type:complete len:475 (+),score=127.39 GEMP01002962.1:124-1548(+)
MDAYRLTNGFRAGGSQLQRGAPNAVAALLIQSKVMDKRHSALISMANDFTSYQVSLAEPTPRPRSPLFRPNPAMESDAVLADNRKMERPNIRHETNSITRSIETPKRIARGNLVRSNTLDSDAVLAERIHSRIARQQHAGDGSKTSPARRSHCTTSFQAFMRDAASHPAPCTQKTRSMQGDRAPFVTAIRSATLAKKHARPNPKAKQQQKSNDITFNPPQRRTHFSRRAANAKRYCAVSAERSSSEESRSWLDGRKPSTTTATRRANTQSALASTALRWEATCDDSDDEAAENSGGSNTPLPDKAMAGMLQLQEMWPEYTFRRFRVWNEKLVKMYDAQRDIHDFTDTEERLLWHGTNLVSAHEIMANGFNRSHCGVAHGSKYGSGTYFTTNLRYAARFCVTSGDDQTKAMFLCRVSVGTWAKGQKGMVEPPRKENAGSAGERYDSTVNDVDNPTIWCVFRDFQAVPVYLFVGRT